MKSRYGKWEGRISLAGTLSVSPLPQFLLALSPFGMLSFLLEGDVFKVNRVLFPQKLKKVIEVGLMVLPIIYSTSIYY